MDAALLLPLVVLADPATLAWRARIPDPEWYERPVAVDLHPVGISYGASFFARFADRIVGRSASPVFAEPVAALDAWWRVTQATGRPPLVAESEVDRWSQVLEIGSGLALVDVAVEAVGRSAGATAAWRMGQGFVAPNVVVERRLAGWRAVVDEPGVQDRPAVVRREVEEGVWVRTPPRPRVAAGLGWVAERADEAATDAMPLDSWDPDAAAWIRLERLGVDDLQVRARLLSRTWEAVARRQVVGRTAASLALVSRDGVWEPRTWTSGLTWRPLDPWAVTARYSHSVVLHDSDPDAWTATLGLRWRGRVHLPVEAGRPLPGERTGRPPRTWPDPEAGEPVRTALPCRAPWPAPPSGPPLP